VVWWHVAIVKNKIMHIIFVPLGMTSFPIPYKNTIMNDKCIFYPQQLQNEKTQESLSEVYRKMESLAKQVSKQQAILSSGEVIFKNVITSCALSYTNCKSYRCILD
jgi:hypothetical protein